jgi:hypothetical protein
MAGGDKIRIAVQFVNENEKKGILAALEERRFWVERDPLLVRNAAFSKIDIAHPHNIEILLVETGRQRNLVEDPQDALKSACDDFDSVAIIGVGWGFGLRIENLPAENPPVVIAAKVTDYSQVRKGTNPDGSPVFRYPSVSHSTSSSLVNMFVGSVNTGGFGTIKVYKGEIVCGEPLMDKQYISTTIMDEHEEVLLGEVQSSAINVATPRRERVRLLIKGACDYRDGNQNGAVEMPSDEEQQKASKNAMLVLLDGIKLGLFGQLRKSSSLPSALVTPANAGGGGALGVPASSDTNPAEQSPTTESENLAVSHPADTPPEVAQTPNSNNKSTGNRFVIAISYAGEYRDDFVLPIAEALRDKFGKDKIFYDRFHQAELPSKDAADYICDIYRNHSDLILVFLGRKYVDDNKVVCARERRAVDDFMSSRKNKMRVLFLDTGDGRINVTYKVPDLYPSLEFPPLIDRENIPETIELITGRLKIARETLLEESGNRSVQPVPPSANGDPGQAATKAANKLPDELKTRYPNDSDLHQFAQDLLSDAPEYASESESGVAVAKILRDFSKTKLAKGDLSNRPQHYLCEAMHLLEKDGSQPELLAECRRLKAESYSKRDGRGNKLMAELFAQDTG